MFFFSHRVLFPREFFFLRVCFSSSLSALEKPSADPWHLRERACKSATIDVHKFCLSFLFRDRILSRRVYRRKWNELFYMRDKAKQRNLDTKSYFIKNRFRLRNNKLIVSIGSCINKLFSKDTIYFILLLKTTFLLSLQHAPFASTERNPCLRPRKKPKL